MQTYNSDFFEVISHNSKKKNHNCQIQMQEKNLNREFSRNSDFINK